MFVEAIEKADQYTRPIHFIARYYGGAEIIPGSATLFFVNELGCAITCKHVAEQILKVDNLYSHHLKFKAELRRFEKDRNFAFHRRRLEDQFRITAETPIRLLYTFLRAVAGYSELITHLHPTEDLAIIQFQGYEKKFYQSHAYFLRDSSKIRKGRSLCRLGYPFPDFTNYRYNRDLDDIEWTNTGRILTPSFPIDGILTRQIGDPNNNKIVGLELSTPGLRGQSGGPLFDRSGIVYGMQSSTRHLHLGFDQINREVVIDGRSQRVSNFPFMSVGHCVHVSVIKDFLLEKSIKFYEAEAD